jgi:hypothetical protein
LATLGVIAVLPSNTSCGVPSLKLSVACIACTRLETIGMEAGILVEWNGIGSVVGAEDVAAVSTMMFADEEVEG